jgi:murein tripeptide amidase MpaA
MRHNQDSPPMNLGKAVRGGTVAEVRFDRFYRYEELTTILQAWAQDRPELCRLESVGLSHEGRDIWLVTVTNFRCGPDTEKPAFWIDANIHATETTGSTALLYLIDKLLRSYESDVKIARVLDTRAFYLLPRLNPDGSELALADRPRYVRSSVRPYPRADPQDGLTPEDIDADGRILMMRIPDPNGAWKAHSDEPRLMVPRDPDEEPGDAYFYRVLPEGLIRNYDGVTIKTAPPHEGLDLNRNFPMEWTTEAEQMGAGPFPTSEPEVRAMVRSIIDRPNICGAMHYHTFSGVYLRPYSAHDDDHFPTADLRTYKLIGEWATKMTGYPALSVFHDFRHEPKESIKGAADDWLYDHLGVFAWTLEFWSPMRQAGVTPHHLVDWFRDHPAEDDLRMLDWNDRDLGGRGYVDWYPFDHPQLGKVELGGWDQMYCWANPPPDLLELEIAPHADFAIFQLAITPLLDIHSVDVRKVGEQTHWVRVVVQNTGWLPTNVSQKALDRKAVRALEIEVALPEGATLASGELRTEAGQLDGRALKRNIYWSGGNESTTDRAKFEWVIEAPSGTSVKIEARHPRAGTVRLDVVLN